MKARMWRACAVVSIVSVSMVQAEVATDQPNAGAEAGAHGNVPKTAMFDSKRATRKLDEAFAIATDRVQEIPQCGDLFVELAADGLEVLTSTIYMPTHPFDEQTLCESAAAFTWVGGVHTRLCRRFTSLSDERAAMTLIHEALHHAGLTERPADPEAMTAREIDALVEDACGKKALKRELAARLER